MLSGYFKKLALFVFVYIVGRITELNFHQSVAVDA
jgi:hypothetical protein